jgi:zinc finger SWIM domain-containing protein 3
LLCFEKVDKGAKNAFAPIRKSTMYDYSDSLQRYHELRNISHTTSFVASRSPEAYERLKHVLHEEAAVILPNGGENGDNKYGPVLPQDLDVDSAEYRNVLDPMHVPGRGAPKKMLKSISNKNRSKVKCTLCKGEGHNRRTCSMREEVVKSNVHRT